MKEELYMNPKALNETTNIGIGNLYDDKEKSHLIENKKSIYHILDITQKENELEIEQHKLSDNIDDLDLVNDNIKNKYSNLIISIISEFCLLWIINILVTPNNIFSITIAGIILTSINILVTTLNEISHKSFKENYRLKNEIFPNLIKNNKDKINSLQKEIDEIKKQFLLQKDNKVNASGIDLPKIIDSDSKEDKKIDRELSSIKIKNYDFNINLRKEEN